MAMTRDAALRFLAAHSPMPDDDRLTDAMIDEYDQVRRFFLAQPDPACIRPLLLSFGRWDGRGVYQLVPSVLRAYSRDLLQEPLVEALSSPHESVRYWACQIAQEFPTAEALLPLLDCLQDGNSDIRMAAAQALEFLADGRAVPALKAAVRRAKDRDESDLIQEVIRALS